MPDQQANIRRPALFANPELPIRLHNGCGFRQFQVNGTRHAGHPGSRNQHKIPGLQRYRRPAVEGQPALAFEHRAVKRLPIVGPLHAPGTGAADHFVKACGGLQQCDDLGQRVDHDRTPANEIWTLKHSKSNQRGLSFYDPHHWQERP